MTTEFGRRKTLRNHRIKDESCHPDKVTLFSSFKAVVTKLHTLIELSELRIAEAARLGCRRVFVSTLHSNLGTLRMYESSGFSECGRACFVEPGRLSEHVFFVKLL